MAENKLRECVQRSNSLNSFNVYFSASGSLRIALQMAKAVYKPGLGSCRKSTEKRGLACPFQSPPPMKAVVSSVGHPRHMDLIPAIIVGRRSMRY